MAISTVLHTMRIIGSSSVDSLPMLVQTAPYMPHGGTRDTYSLTIIAFVGTIKEAAAKILWFSEKPTRRRFAIRKLLD
jgi:hypothetical protein